MCGRTALYVESEDIFGDVGVGEWRNQSEYRPSYNVRPTYRQPCIRLLENGEEYLSNMRWTYSKGNIKTVNARIESIVQQKPFFKSSKRCVVIANGYYEWLRETEKKGLEKQKTSQAYFIHLEESRIMYMAAIYCTSKEEGDGYAIVTRPSDDTNISFIHDRMPILLKRNQVSEWIKGNLTFYYNDNTVNCFWTPDSLSSYPINGNELRGNGSPLCIISLNKGVKNEKFEASSKRKQREITEFFLTKDSSTSEKKKKVNKA